MNDVPWEPQYLDDFRVGFRKLQVNVEHRIVAVPSRFVRTVHRSIRVCLCDMGGGVGVCRAGARDMPLPRTTCFVPPVFFESFQDWGAVVSVA